jgi:hypothetical protein
MQSKETERGGRVTEAMSVEYAGTYMGDCARGCTRPATVRIHKEWIVCALHYEEHLISEQTNEAGMALDLMKAWRSEAEFHGCEHLIAGLDRIAEDEHRRAKEAEEQLKVLERVEYESEPNQEIRQKMGERDV